jgi:hypothetical protein
MLWVRATSCAFREIECGEDLLRAALHINVEILDEKRGVGRGSGGHCAICPKKRFYYRRQLSALNAKVDGSRI